MNSVNVKRSSSLWPVWGAGCFTLFYIYYVVGMNQLEQTDELDSSILNNHIFYFCSYLTVNFLKSYIKTQNILVLPHKLIMFQSKEYQKEEEIGKSF